MYFQKSDLLVFVLMIMIINDLKKIKFEKCGKI